MLKPVFKRPPIFLKKSRFTLYILPISTYLRGENQNIKEKPTIQKYGKYSI